MANMINWFEVPTKDLSRATKFYETILDKEIEFLDFGGFKMGMFPTEEGEVAGALVQHEGYIPSDKVGPLLYLNGGDDLQPILEKVEGAGGKILKPKEIISEENGYMALFLDTEGNRMALHSMG